MKAVKVVWVVMAMVVGFSAVVFGEGGEEEKGKVAEAAVNGAVQDGRYEEALSLLEKRIEANEEREYSLYLKGVVFYLKEDYDGCVRTLDQLLKEYPKGKWFLKARFRQAAAYLSKKEYAAAERIFEEEAERLMSGERKDRIASVYVKFAEEAMSPADKLVKPDYDKAFRLLKKALELQVGKGTRDEVSFKAARCMELSEKWNEAVNEYQSYLTEFGKDGKHKDEARYNSGWCQLKVGQQEESRRVWRDLMQEFQKADKTSLSDEQRNLWAKAAFDIAKTYGLPSPGNTHYLDLGVTALQDFLKQFPEDENAPQAAFDIALSPMNMGRDAEALESFKAFLDGKGYKVVGEKAQETHEKLRMEATYLMGEVYRRQKNYASAIATWEEYVKRFPNGPHWSRAQEGILETEYAKGSDLLEEEKHDEARRAFEEFLSRHPLDRRFASIMYTIGQSYFDQEKWDEAVGEWRKLVSKFPNSEEASQGQFMIGQVFEEKKKELETAIEGYRKVTWGNYKPQAEQRIAKMQQKELTVLTERTFRATEKAKVKVQVRNIETLTVKAYRIDLVDYFRKMHLIRGVEDLDIGLIDPDRVWEVKVEEYAKYKPIEQEIELPFDEPGAYALNISDEKTYEATTLVLKSDLDVIIKSSRKSVFVFAEDMSEKKPFAGVKVFVSDGSKMLCEGETDTDGVFKKDLEELKGLNDLRVLAVKDGSFASNLVGLSGLGFSRGLSPKGYIYTDRPAYRAGQKVNIKGILRIVKDDRYSFEKGDKYVLDIVDSQGRILKSEEISLSEFGSFHSEFDLDKFAPVGDYQLLVHPPQGKQGETFAGSFLVEEYKLEKVKLSLEFERKVYFRGENVEGKIVAAYYYGEPVVGKKVEYWLPDGRHLSDTTDKDGIVRFSMETKEFPEERPLEFSASLPDENVRTGETVYLAVRGFTASVSTIRGVYLSEEKFDVSITTKDLEGKPLSQEMELIVLRREATGKRWSEVEVTKRSLVTDEKSGEGTINVALVKGGPHILRASGKDRFGNRIVAEASVFVSDKEDKTKVRIITDRQHFKVGEEVSVTVHSRLAENLALLTFEGEGILSYRLVTLKEGANPLDMLVGHEHFPNFALGVAVMDGSKFFTAGTGFVVERELKVSVKPAKETLEPGAELVVDIETTDQNGNPVSAELSLAMVDEALFSIFADPLAEISSFFREGQQREAAMRTESSCTFSYAAKTKGISADVVAEMERMAAVDKEAAARGEALKHAGEVVALLGVAKVAARPSVPMELKEEAPSAETFDAMDISGDLDANGAVLGRRFRGVAAGKYAGYAAEPGGPPPAPVRMYFPEVGYWNPSIVTDAQGKGS
ncbi:MAG: tetratricopeptide repeat protein, partial [bacterium]|nr:tetratricopeptide repeat protein [bacterium]